MVDVQTATKQTLQFAKPLTLFLYALPAVVFSVDQFSLGQQPRGTPPEWAQLVTKH